MLRSEPDNSYANDFLATTYVLQDNLEAALKYWNRIGEPRIADVRTEPPLPINPILWDRAFAFSPAAALSLADFDDTKARINSLGVLSRFRFELVPVRSVGLAPAGQDFDVILHALPAGVFGAGWPGATVAPLHGAFLPETISTTFATSVRPD